MALIEGSASAAAFVDLASSLETFEIPPPINNILCRLCMRLLPADVEAAAANGGEVPTVPKEGSTVVKANGAKAKAEDKVPKPKASGGGSDAKVGVTLSKAKAKGAKEKAKAKDKVTKPKAKAKVNKFQFIDTGSVYQESFKLWTGYLAFYAC